MIREAPGNPVIGTKPFQDWHWLEGYGIYLGELKAQLESSPQWAPDGRRKELMINIANIWSDTYTTMDVADLLLGEFQYSAVRDWGIGMVDEARRRDMLATQAGMEYLYWSLVVTEAPGQPGSFDYAESLLGNLAWYLTTRTENTMLAILGTGTPHVAGWDTLNWRGCVDVANEQLGEALGHPYTLASGTDPLGNQFVVKARHYQNGLSIVRARGDWNQGIPPASAVPVDLPTALTPIRPSGAIEPLASQVMLRAGQGMVFLGDPGAPVPVLLGPTANAGPDLDVVDVDGDGQEQVSLDGSGSSDPDGRLLFYEWSMGGEILGRSRTINPILPVGLHNVTLAVKDREGLSSFDHVSVRIRAVDMGNVPLVALKPIAPNPFMSGTTVSYDLSQDGMARIDVYDVRGRHVRTLLSEEQTAGSKSIRWDGRDNYGKPVSSGIYLIHVRALGESRLQKAVLMR
jgi:hypothetical protein